MSDTLPIFVINLPSAIKRRRAIEEQLRRLNLDYQIIEAINGNCLELNLLDELYEGRLTRPNPYNSQIMSQGAVGCLMSHIKSYNYIIEHNIEIACIIEDDAKLLPAFPQVLRAIKNRRDWEILLFGHYSMHYQSDEKGALPLFWKRHVTGRHCITKPAEFPFLTVGYAIKLPTAYKLREFAYPFRMPADWVTGNAEIVSAKLKIISPPVITRNIVDGELSYVEKISTPYSQSVEQSNPDSNPAPTRNLSKSKFGLRLKHLLAKLYWWFRFNYYTKRLGLYPKSYIRPID